MMAQKFYASPRDTFTWPNGAVGHRPGGPMDCLGPYARVRNCPIAGTEGPDGKPLRLTAYATGYADTFFSVPACTRYKGKHIGGYFSMDGGNIEFRPYDRYKGSLPMKHIPQFTVYVGNIGEVWKSDDKETAERFFDSYVAASKANEGRASGESVTMFEDGEPVREYVGTNDKGE